MHLVPTCSYLYPHGHRCGRIPAKGESLCRDHRRQPLMPTECLPPSSCDEDLFSQQMFAYSDSLRNRELSAILDSAQNDLNALEPILDRPLPLPLRSAYTRATIAVIAAIDVALEVAAPSNRPPSVSTLSAEQFDQLCEQVRNLVK